MSSSLRFLLIAYEMDSIKLLHYNCMEHNPSHYFDQLSQYKPVVL